MKKILIFVFLFIISCPLLYGTTWTGNTSGLVSLSSNWVGGVPSSNSNLIFQSIGRSDIIFNWPSAPTTVNDIIFNSNSKDYTFNGNLSSQYLRVGNIYNNEPSSSQTFNVNIELKNNRTIRTEGEINFNKNIFLQSGNGNLSFDGGGIINFGENTQLENITNLTLMNGIDLNLGGASLDFNSLTITGPSIIDFSNSSQINIENLNFSGGGVLTILNWSINDYFIIQNQVQSTDLSKIIFDGISNGATWDSNGQLIPVPVPEPNTFWFISIPFLMLITRRKTH